MGRFSELKILYYFVSLFISTPIPMDKTGFVYILLNQSNTVFYSSVTSNLEQRLYQHRTGYFKDAFKIKIKPSEK
ncbi:GIY-YIG nuclease family protein [Marinilabilia sp.]|uniref:GIY-YIG nuclease family protein n=1 Tax=Marinilabilia sp. TaxID=2021252 RepID=UPI00345D2930